MPYENRLKTKWDNGDTVWGAWCASSSPINAETFARLGFDYVGVDMQHGLIGYSEAVAMIQAISAGGSLPIVRVSANDAATIGKVLDAGAEGVVVPMVNSVEEAAAAVAACRYPPRGVRSFGPIRASLAIGSREPRELEAVVCSVMIETVGGLENLEEIAATPGVDVIYVGPSDLALALSLPPAYELEDSLHRQAIERIKSTCETHGIIPGIHCDGGEMAKRRHEQGFRMMTLVNDTVLVRNGAREQIGLARAS